MSEDPNGFDSHENEAPPTNGPDNRGFILVVSVLGGIFLLALVAMAVVVAIVLPRNRAQEATQVALVYQQNTATALVATQAATLNFKTVTSTPLPPTATLTSTATIKPSSTALLAVASNTPTPTLEVQDPRTATVAALLTQAAQAQLTVTVMPSATALPTTGFVEEAGIPGLFGLAIILLAVIFLVRHLRSSATA